MPKKPDDIIRVGDRVKVLTPWVFVRCGYPKTVRDYLETVNMDLVTDAMETWGFSEADNLYWEIKTAVARAMLRRDGFGGPVRKIHHKASEDLRGAVGTVTAKRYVVTGIYTTESVFSPDGLPEFTGPYLANPKRIPILSVKFGYKDGGVFAEDFEAANLIKTDEPPLCLREGFPF